MKYSINTQAAVEAYAKKVFDEYRGGLVPRTPQFKRWRDTVGIDNPEREDYYDAD